MASGRGTKIPRGCRETTPRSRIPLAAALGFEGRGGTLNPSRTDAASSWRAWPTCTVISRLFRVSFSLLVLSCPFVRVVRSYSLRNSSSAPSLLASVKKESRWNDAPHTSTIFSPRIAIFSQFQVYSNAIEKAKQIINLFQWYHTDELKKKATNYCVRFGHSLWSVNQLPAQEVNWALLY